MQRRTLFALAALIGAFATPALSQSKEIRIAHIYSKTGPLEAYGKQTATGFMMGLDYATGGVLYDVRDNLRPADLVREPTAPPHPSGSPQTELKPTASPAPSGTP